MCQARLTLLHSILQRIGEGGDASAVHGQKYHVIAEHELVSEIDTDDADASPCGCG